MGLVGAILKPISGGLLGEDLTSKIPGLGSLTGSKSDAEKALEAKQQQLAREAQARMAQNDQARQRALDQTMMAFGPQNQMMAQMFGPESAFNPQQMAQMSQNPNIAPPQLDPRLQNYRGNNPNTQAEVEAFLRQKAAWEQEQARRNQMFQQNIPNPAAAQQTPFQQTAPQAARRY